jgi:hypothetical protein
MGTSTVQRSPRTDARWRLVNNLYENSAISPERLLAEVFNAAAEDYSGGLSDSAVQTRLRVLLLTVDAGAWREDVDAALDAARNAVNTAQRDALNANQASFFGDLADRALHATLAGGVMRPHTLATTQATLSSFISNLVGVAIDHVVSRDITAHLGRNNVSTATQTLALRRKLVQHARQIADDQRVVSELAAAADEPLAKWQALITYVWDVGSTIPSSASGHSS